MMNQKQLQSCWIRGPYSSPYRIARDFSHLVLISTGIGITPALGVMGQYFGYSRTKILIWLTKDADKLRFFAPLLDEAHLAFVFYTGKTKLTNDEVRDLEACGKIFIQQYHPSSLTRIVEKIVIAFEKNLNLSAAQSLHEMEKMERSKWCLLYCGGRVEIKNQLHEFSRVNKLGFESEMFDW
jgi:hypothetical protein